MSSSTQNQIIGVDNLQTSVESWITNLDSLEIYNLDRVLSVVLVKKKKYVTKISYFINKTRKIISLGPKRTCETLTCKTCTSSSLPSPYRIWSYDETRPRAKYLTTTKISRISKKKTKRCRTTLTRTRSSSRISSSSYPRSAKASTTLAKSLLAWV